MVGTSFSLGVTDSEPDGADHHWSSLVTWVAVPSDMPGSRGRFRAHIQTRRIPHTGTDAARGWIILSKTLGADQRKFLNEKKFDVCCVGVSERV